jgi:hypothetical protein
VGWRDRSRSNLGQAINQLIPATVARALIISQTSHRSADTVRCYMREGSLFLDTAASLAWACELRPTSSKLVSGMAVDGQGPQLCSSPLSLITGNSANTGELYGHADEDGHRDQIRILPSRPT